jgi:protein SCO1
MKGRKNIFGLVIAIILAFISGACKDRNASTEAVVFSQPVSDISSLASIDDQGALPDFSLIDQNGRTVTLADFKGQVWVADFFFSHCKGACPMMAKNMAQMQQLLSGSGLRLVSITVDPERDTSERLAEYARLTGAKEESWLFLTGKKSEIIDLSVKGFRLSASPDDPTTHSQRLILIDRDGHIRGYYSNDNKAEIELLKRNAAQLLKK